MNFRKLLFVFSFAFVCFSACITAPRKYSNSLKNDLEAKAALNGNAGWVAMTMAYDARAGNSWHIRILLKAQSDGSLLVLDHTPQLNAGTGEARGVPVLFAVPPDRYVLQGFEFFRPSRDGLPELNVESGPYLGASHWKMPLPIRKGDVLNLGGLRVGYAENDTSRRIESRAQVSAEIYPALFREIWEPVFPAIFKTAKHLNLRHDEDKAAVVIDNNSIGYSFTSTLDPRSYVGRSAVFVTSNSAHVLFAKAGNQIFRVFSTELIDGKHIAIFPTQPGVKVGLYGVCVHSLVCLRPEYEWTPNNSDGILFQPQSQTAHYAGEYTVASGAADKISHKMNPLDQKTQDHLSNLIKMPLRTYMIGEYISTIKVKSYSSYFRNIREENLWNDKELAAINAIQSTLNKCLLDDYLGKDPLVNYNIRLTFTPSLAIDPTQSSGLSQRGMQRLQKCMEDNHVTGAPNSSAFNDAFRFYIRVTGEG